MSPVDDVARPLPLRLYRMVCAATTLLTLAVAAPMNALQNLPPAAHALTVAIGLTTALCWWESRRGRDHPRTLLGVLVVLLDALWFWNGGSSGSVTFFFLVLLLYPLTVLRGRARWLACAGVVANACLLLVVDFRWPWVATPHGSPADRFFDLLTGVFCASLLIVAILALVLNSYEEAERRRQDDLRALEAGAEKYREIFNATGDALIIHDGTGRIQEANDRMLALFDVPRAELPGLRTTDLVAETPLAGRRVPFLSEPGPGSTLWRCRRRSGAEFWAEVDLHAARIGGNDGWIASLRDVTERRRTEEALRANEERLRLALEATHQGWFDLNLRTGAGVSSPEYARMIGHDPATFQTSLQSWSEGIHPDDRATALQVFKECVASGATRVMEYRRQTREGAWKWIRSIGQVVEHDAAGRPVRMIGTHTDITERKQLEAQLLHHQRLEAVGSLASGVAHELNNILTPMLVASQALHGSLEDPRDREMITLLENGAKRGATIVRQLLAFSRQLAEDRRAVDPVALVREMATIVRATFPREIEVVEQVPAGVPAIRADATQIHQVLMNLCVNARDAMPGGGRLTLSVETVVASAAAAEAPGRREVLLAVADTGHGIPATVMERIFDPFFTTKEVGKGSGLGLATVHGIVKSHGGRVAVQSEVGRGTVFRVHLPVDGEVAPAQNPAPAAVPAGRGQDLLVIDDEPAVVAMTKRILERNGYRVAVATSGEDALALFASRAGELPVVLTDFMMPGMSGPALVQRLRALSPGVRVIGMSGQDRAGEADALRAVGFAEVLAKPFEMAALLQAVARQMSAAGANGGHPPERG